MGSAGDGPVPWLIRWKPMKSCLVAVLCVVSNKFIQHYNICEQYTKNKIITY